MRDLKQKIHFSHSKDLELKKLELALISLSIRVETGWAKFQEILNISERVFNYWDRKETQKDLRDLFQFIDLWSATEFHDKDLKANLKDFLLGDYKKGINISWDHQYHFEDFLKNQPLDERAHLYPEDIFWRLTNLDRSILFCREEQRKRKYELIQLQIDSIN